MLELNKQFISRNVASSDVIFQRGERIYEYGGFMCVEAEPEKGLFVYDVDGNYGDYTTRVQFFENDVNYSCDCPYPGKGCKHTVAVMLDVRDRMTGWRVNKEAEAGAPPMKTSVKFLDAEEIRVRALEDRESRAKSEELSVIQGDMYKGEHVVETPKGRQYRVTLHDPVNGRGHCSCPDFDTNRLGVCKHMVFLREYFQNKRGFKTRAAREKFPFVDIFWDSTHERPRMFNERPPAELRGVKKLLNEHFDDQGLFSGEPSKAFPALFSRIEGHKRIRVQEQVLRRISDLSSTRQLEEMAEGGAPELDALKTELYPYQKEGVAFGLYRRAVLIGDEMGLGKTLQAIALSLLKREIFGFDKVLVVTLASLKEQWKREIERFTDESAMVVAGTAPKRKEQYASVDGLFKITNYEAVLRDVEIISRFKPDVVILDEAQRIKNFNTKTADAVKRLPREHAMVLTGTPLENKLEDVYSIIQFLDPYMLSPLWQFAADHFMLSPKRKGKILGYRNLDLLHEKLKSIVIRRRKEEVLSDLPDEVVNNYYLDLTPQQVDIHAEYARMVVPLLNKKFLTPVDFQRLMTLLLKMRQVCDSTYLIDRETNLSPKLKELEGILDELVLENGRKVVIFSEWTTMTYLIARQLSNAGIPFVELSGKIPVKKRQALIDEFTHNPDCKVFLSTDAGGTGLNLQAADCVVNFELPWNPAKMNQRIGRVNRIGQKSGCVNVVNLITKNSIEEKILTGLQIKTDLFEGVFDGGMDTVEFSQARRTELLNKLRAMIGDDLEPVLPEAAPPEEIPEDTPHFLNPRALADEEPEPGDAEISGDGEAEARSAEGPGDAAKTVETAARPDSGESRQAETAAPEQSPEKMEKVLNTGMQFISGLLEMATGQKMETTDDQDKMIRLDKETGEVTMKFKLPGF